MTTLCRNARDFPLVFFRDVVVLPGSTVARMPITSTFLEACEAFAAKEEEEGGGEKGKGNVIERVLRRQEHANPPELLTRRTFVGIIRCETVPVEGEECDDTREKEYVGTVCEIVSVGEKPRKELMEQNGAYWYVNEGRDGVFDGDFNLLRSRGQEADAYDEHQQRCAFACLVGTGIKCKLKKIERRIDSQDPWTSSVSIEDARNYRRYDFELRRRKIRAAKEGTVVDLFVDGNANTQTSRYLEKLDPLYAMKSTKANASLLKDAMKCKNMVNRCGGNDRLARANNDGTFPYVSVSNSPVPFCSKMDRFEFPEDDLNDDDDKYYDLAGKSILECKNAVEASFIGKNLFHDESDAGISGHVLRHAKEFSYLQCRRCRRAFGNASKMIKAINPLCRNSLHLLDHDPICYGPGASKIFFNPVLYECEILTADAHWIYNCVDGTRCPAGHFRGGWGVDTDMRTRVNASCSFFDYYGWQHATCQHCHEHLGWKFECLIQHEGTLHRDAFLMKHGGESLLKDEDTLPRIFFGFLKNKVSTALPQTEVEIERCKHIESYDAQPLADWNYWRKHRTYRADDPLELVQSDDSLEDDDEEEEEEEEEE